MITFSFGNVYSYCIREIHLSVIYSDARSQERPSHLAMEWRMSDWPAAHKSSLRLSFEEGDSEDGVEGTWLELEQRGVPTASLETTARLWAERVFRAIKLTFGYGANMF